MTEDTSPENLRKFLESDDPAMVRMGISMAKGTGVEVTVKDLEHFLKSELPNCDPDRAIPLVVTADVETVKTGIMLADEAGVIDEAMEMLCELLLLGDKAVSSNVANTLGEIGDVRMVEPLIKALEDEDSGVRNLAANTLGKIGDKRAVEPLIKELGDGNSSAAKALGEIGDTRAVEPLINTLGDDEGDVRYYAVEALGKIGGGRAVEPLIGMLGDDKEYVRMVAAMALGGIGDERAVEPLIKALEDDDVDVRLNAVEALGATALDQQEICEDYGIVSYLYDALESEDEDRAVRSAAKDALENLGREFEEDFWWDD